MYKLVLIDNGQPVRVGDQVILRSGRVGKLTMAPTVAGFKSVSVDGEPFEIDDIMCEWRELPDTPKAMIVERHGTNTFDAVYHGPFDDDSTALEWANKNIPHVHWHCAPLHKPQ